MAEFNKLIDERIKILKDESANQKAEQNRLDAEREQLNKQFNEMAAQKAELDRREQSIIERESGLKDDVTIQLDRKKDTLLSDIDALDQKKQLLANQIELLTVERSNLQIQKEADKRHFFNEKEIFLEKIRMEKSSEKEELERKHIQEISQMNEEQEHLRTMLEKAKVEAEQKKRDIFNDAAEFQEKLRNQIAEERESMLAKIAADRAVMEEELQYLKIQRTQELTNILEMHEKEITDAQLRKQTLNKDIEVLEYKFERSKAEISVELERFRASGIKDAELEKSKRMSVIDKLETEALSKIERMQEEAQNRIKDEQLTNEKEINEMRNKKDSLHKEIGLLEITFNRTKSENEVELEKLRSDKVNESNLIISKMQKEIETLRYESESMRKDNADLTERLQIEQQTLIERQKEDILRETAQTLESQRVEKLAKFTESINQVTLELEKLTTECQNLERDRVRLFAETQKIKMENETLLKELKLEQQVELEKQKSLIIKETDDYCQQKRTSTEQYTTQIQKEAERTVAELKEEIETLTKNRKSTVEEIDSLKSKLNKMASEQLAELERNRIEAFESLEVLKLDKLRNISEYLERYKTERFNTMQEDIERQIEAGYKTLEELVELNADYNKRMLDLNRASMELESEKRNFIIREKLFIEEKNDFEATLKNEMNAQIIEHELIVQMKQQQIVMLQEKHKALLQEIEEYRTEIMSEGGRSKQEMVREIDFLKRELAALQAELQSKPTASYIMSLEEKYKNYENLERENKRLAITIVTLEKERSNWRIAADEISRLHDEKEILERRLNAPVQAVS